VIHDPLFRLRLRCANDIDPDPIEALLVDLDRGHVISANQNVAMALDVVEAEIRRVVSHTGEVPEIGEVRPWIWEAWIATGCDVDYEPLGFYDEAEITTDCRGERIARVLRFPSDDGSESRAE